jgi:hypothetical protein
MDNPLLSFASSHSHGSPDSLAKKDQSDVGALSCQVTFKPVSAPLQHGVRFFRHPHPHRHGHTLRDAVPNGLGAIRGSHVPLKGACQVRRLLWNGKSDGHERGNTPAPFPAFDTVLARA